MIDGATQPPGHHSIRNAATQRRGLACVRGAVLAVATVTAWLGGPRDNPAFAQSNFYYGGGTRTWSNASSWWSSYLATAPTQATQAPGSNDTAIFNTSGSNAAGTALFTGDASVRGLRILQPATGGLTLRGDGGDRTLTLGSGGIRVEPGNTSALSVGSASAGQRLNVVLGASQEWRMAGGNVTISNTISGAAASGTSQTLLISNAATVTTNGFANGAGGGTLNLWVNNTNNVPFASPSALTGTLTLQNIGAPSSFTPPGVSGTFPSLSRLQLAGGNISGATSVNSAGTVELLGGASGVLLGQTFTAGTYVRSPGGGIFGLPGGGTVTATSVPLVNGLMPWAVGGSNDFYYRTWNGTSIVGAALSLPDSWSFNNITNPAGNYQLNGSNVNTQTLTKSNTASALLYMPQLNLDTHSLTVNGFSYYGGSTTPFIRANPGGSLRIGSSGELVVLISG
ncbi:MAG: hypothetical protein ACKOC4_08520, partial [Planctomycetia bacterium]